MIVYIGCSTDASHRVGIHTIEVDPAGGAMIRRATTEVANPLFFAKSADGRFLYCAEADGVGSFEILPDGSLRHVDCLSLGGKAMCHVSLSADGTRLAWAAYSNGLAGSVPVKDGKFGVSVFHRHEGIGPNLPRQDMAHPHCAVQLPDASGYVVCDLGLDKLFTYRYNGSSDVFDVKPSGVGPRHILFHPNGRLAFVVTELGNLLTVYEWNAASGFGRMLDQQPTVPDAWKGVNWDSAIRFTPDGNCVVVSNRGYDSLTVFGFDAATGKLAFRNRSVLPGTWPRDFAFLGEDLAIVTQERSGYVLTLRYEASTGSFSTLGVLSGFNRPLAIAVR